MPELPEVETLRRQLSHAVCGKKISAVQVHNSAVIRAVSPAVLMRGLVGARIQSVLRRGKALICELSTGKALLVHLKMTGQLVYPGSGEDSKVRFFFDDKTSLDLRDRRLFAELRLLSDWRQYPFIRDLGPDPLAMSIADFRAAVAGKKTKIKPLIMDQTVVSGIGNLYACEALYASGIHPGRPASSLNEKEVTRLFSSIQLILRDAVSHNGSSIDQFVQLSGRRGGYVPYHRVYARQGKPCLACSAPIERVVLGGRGTYLCPQCQK